MRVAQLVEASLAGVGRHVMDLTEGLLSRGHEVHLLYSDLRSDHIFAEDLCCAVRHPGFRSAVIPMRRSPSGSDVKAARLLRRYVQCHGPFDLIHCHSTKAGLVGRLACLDEPVKRIYTPNGFFSMDPNGGAGTRRVVGVLEAFLANLCCGVIVVSHAEYEHALDLGIPASKLCLVHNGVPPKLPHQSPLNRNAIRREWGVENDEICIGFVGQLVPVKSPETMLRSFAALLRRIGSTPVRLMMVGDGPLKISLLRLAAELHIDAQVNWLGARDAKTLMHAFDILTLTSDSEGHPFVVLEALASGLPIVATSVGGIAETVHPDVNGFVAPTRGITEIAYALNRLVGDAELRQRMGRASRAIAEDFSLDRMIDRTLAFYEHVTRDAQRNAGFPEKEMTPLT